MRTSDYYRLACLVALVAACENEPGSPSASPPAVLSVSKSGMARGLAVQLVVELESAARVEVDYWTAAGPRLRVASSEARTHGVLLSRLIASAVYDYEVRSIAPDGRRSEPHSGVFITDTLPTDLRAVRFVARGRPTMPLALLPLRIAQSTISDWWFVIIDEDGQVVWYWQTASPPQAATRLPNGNFVFQDGPLGGLTEVSPEGRVVAQLPQPGGGVERIHHDVIVTASGTVLFLATAGRTYLDTLWMGEEIWEWDPARGVETRRWTVFDFMSPLTDRGSRSRPDDWLHANSISFGPRGNILVSFHFLDQIISISPDYKALEWRLGGPGSSFSLGPEAVFSGQHTATEVQPGRVLMFDNGFARADGGRYSRALELELNFTTSTAQRVWEFRPRPDNYSRFISSARRLDNGNTVVAFGASAGALGSTGPIEVYEVTPSNRVIWHLLVGGVGSMYRATPLASVSGEVEVLDR